MRFNPIAPILAEVVIALDDALGAAWRWFKGPQGGPGSGLTNQTRQQLLRSKSSLEELVAEHEQKLAEYRADPFKFDNQGVLKNAPSDEIRQKIIAGRLNAIAAQIAKQRGELQKVLELLK